MTEINPDRRPDVPPLAHLRAGGYDVLCTSHSEAILASDFPDALADIEAVLGGFTINAEEIVRGGGGETPFTQRLRRGLVDKGWRKREFVIRKLIDEVETQATSHEVDHVKRFDKGTVALEIEWNNKDPFYDRDLDNFKRLHADGGISAGAIITRGASLQDSIRPLLTRFGSDRGIRGFAQLEKYDYFPTRRQREAIEKRVKAGASFVDAWVSVFSSDKFGEATTHWRKLDNRVTRGGGNPCPLVLIGLPARIVSEGRLPRK
jgi:hypothetical protein